MPHETVLFADHDAASVDARLTAVFGPTPHLTVDPTIRVCVSAEFPEAWTIHVPAPRHAPHASPAAGALDWTVPDVATAYADTLVSILVRRGLASPTPAIERIITPADRELATGVPGGAAYGPSTNGLRATLLRSPVVQPTPGLFHIGASARPGPGLPFAALSAWHVSELLNPRTTRSP
jgi:1-hydroxycarotenoid 3,4-desaturase